MKRYLSKYKWIYIIVFVAISFIIPIIIYEYKYPCVYGHYEQQWQIIYDSNMNMMGGYYADVFVCDCRTVRDSIKVSSTHK